MTIQGAGARIDDVPVNGISLRVITWGRFDASMHPVFLIHGITANSLYWSRLGPQLFRQGLFPIAIDLRGRGRSDKPPHGYGLPFHVNDILAVAEHFGLGKVHIVGHSLGGLIGLYLAAVYPHRIEKLVLVDAGGQLPDDAMEAIAPALARLGKEYPSLDAYLDTMLSSPHFSGDREFWQNYFRYDAETRSDGTTLSNIPPAAITEEQASLFLTNTAVLPNYVKSPTLIVRATVGLIDNERGQILPADEAERLAGIMTDSRIVQIEGTNHYTVALADQFGTEVTQFLLS